MSATRKWLFLGIVGACCTAGAFLYPLPRAISYQDALPWRIFEWALALGVLGGIGIIPARRRKVWFSLASAAAVLTGALFILDSNAKQSCLAGCNSRQMVIGLRLQDYATSETGASNDDILFDAGCQAERAWTTSSISECRIVLLVSALTCIPLAALFGGSLIQASTKRCVWSAGSAPAKLPERPRENQYDAFISYRRSEPDRDFALNLLAYLEAAGFHVAFDERDFRANEQVIGEMERCIQESRFTLCVISPRYITSGYCSVEAEVCKTLDMDQRRRRLVPLYLERISLPAWFGGLVGIDFATQDPAFDPYEKLKALLATGA